MAAQEIGQEEEEDLLDTKAGTYTHGGVVDWLKRGRIQHTDTKTHTHTQPHTHSLTPTHTNIHTYIQTHPLPLAHVHACRHTHTYTRVQNINKYPKDA